MATAKPNFATQKEVEKSFWPASCCEDNFWGVETALSVCCRSKFLPLIEELKIFQCSGETSLIVYTRAIVSIVLTLVIISYAWVIVVIQPTKELGMSTKEHRVAHGSPRYFRGRPEHYWSYVNVVSVTTCKTRRTHIEVSCEQAYYHPGTKRSQTIEALTVEQKKRLGDAIHVSTVSSNSYFLTFDGTRAGFSE